ncbi:ABC transporter permease [Demequina muriae]|uniref:ABC transporter permease n=1 Tax=Demequina muriae TaxID=3051664 RepID=A0ABT8GHI8_9MICO|nr:ABC transporter permease [Demequina sp. EGI L300058]MDN4480898.1 ABC transporter permease [Demequina sp. EGI L300058]
MLWLIAKREFRTRALSKANLISSGIMLVIIVGAALILKPFIVGGDDEPDVVEVDSATAGALIPHLEAAAAAQEFDAVFDPVDAPAEPELAEGISGVIVGPADAPELFVDGAQESLMSVVTAATQAAVLESQVSDLGGDPATVNEALALAVPTVTLLGDDDGGFESGSFFAGFAVILVLFFVLIQSSSVIMMGVVEEKSSRVVEILLATVRPSTLLGGKILGVGLYTLLQAAGMVLPLLFAAWHLELLGALEIGVGQLLVNFSVWFVLGFALFTVLFGGLAALVSRQEDIGSVSTPMMLLMMAPLYLAIYLVPSSPDGPVTTVLTQVPFFAPFMVPMRSAFGAITTGETLLAVALCLISIPLLTWLAGRVYAGAVLNTGGRMKLKDALRRG